MGERRFGERHVFNEDGDAARIVVTIQGPQASGKTLLRNAIWDMLENCSDRPEVARFLSVNGDRRVVFVEVQP